MAEETGFIDDRTETVIEVSCDVGLEIAWRGLSLAVCALAARCDDPYLAVQAFIARLPVDILTVLRGEVRISDDA